MASWPSFLPLCCAARLIWLFSILLFLHILGAIFWFGTGMMMHFVFVPSLSHMSFEAQHAWLQALAKRYGPTVAPIALLTILFGILRGVATGTLTHLTTPYGLTYLAAILLAVPLIVIGAGFTGPTAAKLATAQSASEVQTLAQRIARYGRLEIAGFTLMLGLMVAMHAGY
jgi:uncharacterized membrane protein